MSDTSLGVVLIFCFVFKWYQWESVYYLLYIVLKTRLRENFNTIYSVWKSCMRLDCASGLHILHFVPGTRCKCLLTRVWTMSKKLRSFENEYQTRFLSARPNWFIRWLKCGIKTRISVAVEKSRDSEISGFGRQNKKSRMSWSRLQIFICTKIFTRVIGSIEYVTPLF